MTIRRLAVRPFLGVLTVFGLTSVAAQTPSQKEVAALFTGKLAYVENGMAKLISIGKGSWTPVSIVEVGDAVVRWGTDSTRLFAATTTDLFRLDVSGRSKTKVNKSAVSLMRPDAFAPHPNGTELVYAQSNGIMALEIATGTVRKLVDNTMDIQGELGISADGNRLVGRGSGVGTGSDLFTIDIKQNLQFKYGHNCSSGISPNGSKLMKNGGPDNSEHTDFTVYNWGNPPTVLKICYIRDGVQQKWDNQHWSNDSDFISTESYAGLGVIQVSTGRSWAIGPVVVECYPDLWVAHAQGNAGRARPAVRGRRLPDQHPELSIPGLTRGSSGTTLFSLRGERLRPGRLATAGGASPAPAPGRTNR